MYFGPTLESPAPDTIEGIWGFPEKMIKATQYCLDDEIEAIFYHSLHTSSFSQGRLYMKSGDEYKEGLHIQFDFANLAEVESILRTISKQ